MTHQAWGIDVGDLPQGYTPLELTAIIKCIDEEGNLCLAMQHSGGLTTWEVLGMYESGAETMRDEMKNCFVTDTDEEDEDG